MTKILWFSRHELDGDQRLNLKRIYGSELEITQINKTVSSAFELTEEIKAADVVAIVAPINLQAQFLKLAAGKPVIASRNNRIVSEDGEKVTFVFDAWFQIDKVEVVTHDL